MFSLSWKEFDHKASKSYRDYIKDTDFTDVTLACDDNGRLEAHKLILSSSSPVLGQILVGNPHQHPLIYFRKVKFSCLQSLVQFIYLGQVEVEQTELQDFINLAKELEIEGLSNDPQDISKDADSKPSSVINENILDLKTDEYESKEIVKEDHSTEIMEMEPQLAKEVDQIDSAYIKGDSIVENNGNGFKCKECGKCFSLNGNLRTHKMSAHMGIRHPCEQCRYKATTKASLKRHVKRHTISSLNLI